MKFAVLALTLLLAVASQAAPAEEANEIAHMVANFKHTVQHLQQILDATIAKSPNSQLLHAPPLISSALGNIFAALEANEDAIVASLTAGHEIFSQMIRADELRNEWQTNVNHLDSVFRGHLAEYNGLLRPIVAEFKRVSMEFSAAIKPQVDILRGEFWSNTEETITAMGPVAHTVMKMARNLRESATEYARDYTTELQNMYSNIEQLSPEEKARKRERMNEIGQEIMLKFQELYGVANGAPAQS